MKVYFIGLTLLCGLAMVSCKTGMTEEEVREYKAQVLAERALKDKHFASSHQSPFADLTEEFTGLKYYDPNPEYNVSARWEEPDSLYTAMFVDSKGGKRYFMESGKLKFVLKNKKLELPIWRDEADSMVLFIMFRDLTNDSETYPGGRYIEMPWPEDFDDFMLDFNQAFNPYCHYNANYSCPVIPQNLKLDLRIEAGEKRYN